MRPLGDADILAAWEAARGRHPIDQALVLLMAAEPSRSRDELASLPIGRRDARLLALRLATFGDALNGRCACPRCGEAAEFEVSCDALRMPDAGVGERTLDVEGYRLCLRPLDSFDLAAAAGATEVAEARRMLLRRCVVEAARDDAPIAADELPETLGAAIAQAALRADPQAELLFELACPVCGHRWQAVLDIAHILWKEVDARAQRLLTEVHLLARAYGWREADILGMGPARRNAYLQRVTA
ncbi:MAG: hypothetical protein OHM77_08810 [Candidatus Nitricoxidivorans perseverans]|uniref:Phage baseplate protein n=1 Tax=Candidatus Nitricoxidivorans perseverans TaxID=2975601 RepID=A0AA49IU94_9PROT|nr:MAG: hypothetical protein OHM77_08810 [Candidatus Nitricoxidivorans perseverans]